MWKKWITYFVRSTVENVDEAVNISISQKN
jgi:hypothetical protein